MANPWWADFYKIFSGAFRKDPLWIKSNDDLVGAGYPQPEAMPDLRGMDSFGSGGGSRISNDFIDLSSVTNRQSRYKEYERLRTVAEIEMAMTTIADEACVAGETQIATLYHGYKSIKWLTENMTEPFLVYCYDFQKQDYTLGWAYDPRKVKTATTLKISLDDGHSFVVTPDHRILLRSGEWVAASELKYGSELMPFYKLRSNRNFNDLKSSQFPRIFTFEDGWKHERQFIDEWTSGKKNYKQIKVNEACRILGSGLGCRDITRLSGHRWNTINSWMRQEGFTIEEARWLSKKSDRRRVVGKIEWKTMDVYDLSVKEHENFCTDSVVMHNCQRGENGNVCEIRVRDEKVKEEIEFLFFNRKMLNVNRRIWNWTKNLCIMGDHFLEIVINHDSPKDGILKVVELPCDTMYRIETTKSRLLEFQQSKEGPDYQAILRADVLKATETDLMASKAVRFSPYQCVHFRIGDDRKTFYPYGVSLIEAARGPAHQLRLMEDAMVVYRLTRAPERRVFYIDVGQLAPFRAEAFLERLKDQFRKKKMASSRGGMGASAVEERWHAPSADEDYWLPIRPNSNTRIETLPGAQNLGEIDDAVYFRKKLFTALNFPMSYFDAPDANTTRITLSAQDCKFARMIERIQAHVVDGLLELAERHLELKGFPEESYDDLQIIMTPPSHWKELSEMEIISSRIQNASTLKQSLLMGDFDVLTRWMMYSEEEAQAIISRSNIQKYQDAKLQILMANPALMGVGMPGQGEQELGSEAGGPNPMLSPGGDQPPPEENGENSNPPTEPTSDKDQTMNPSGVSLPDPSPEEVKKYDLEIQGYSKEQDLEDIDYSERN